MDRTSLFTAVAIGAPLLGALAAIARRHVRVIGFAASFAAAVASLLLLRIAPDGQRLDEAVMLLFSCLTAGATLVVPQRDCTPRLIAGVLFVLASTLLAYSTDNFVVLLAGWLFSALPFLAITWFGAPSWRPRLALVASTFALAGAILLIATESGSLAISALHGKSPGGMPAFAFLVLAVMLRKGLVPFHAWIADAAEGGSPIPLALLLNGHYGAMLVAKVIAPLFVGVARDLSPVLSHFALATALYTAVRALTENSPRRLLALIALGQSACILAGLESGTAEGVAGALVHWIVVTVSTTGLFGVLRLLEVRFGENLTAGRHLGLTEHAPRLGVFFIVFGLALVGLPGTLSFCSQDLLIHGALASHPQTGLLLPIATAMNAVSICRLFARLFLGKRRTGFTVPADALPRERWILTAGLLVVALGGLHPSGVVIARSPDSGPVQEALRALVPDAGRGPAEGIPLQPE
jgi:NADH-quinone oxidoreductase subunit M